MGLRSWFKRSIAPKPRRPWVRPEFLGLGIFIGSLAGLAFLTGLSANPGEPGTQHQYVAVDPAAPSLLECAPDCPTDAILQDWKASHPNAEIVGVTPRYQDGRLVGYDVIYRE